MRYFIINENMEKLAKDKKLRPIELMVMANIYSFYKSNMDCKESMKSFANRFGVTYPTIMKCFDNLVNKNIIVKGEKLDRNNNIWLLSDETIKAIDEPTENKQESKQDNKQEIKENAIEEPKEEKTVNTTLKEEKAENEQNINDNDNVNNNYNRGYVETYTSWLYDDNKEYY